jgi:tight adherence protein B
MFTITLKDFWYAAILSLVLVAIILAVTAIQQFFIEPRRKRQKVSRRLSEGYEKRLELINILKEGSKEPTGWWPKLLAKVLGQHRLANLKTWMMQADVHEAPEKMILRNFVLSLLVFVAGALVLKNFLLGLLLGCGVWAVIFFYLGRKKKSKTRKFEAQMPDSMELLARSLRAGYALPAAIELVGEEMPEPMGTEMMIVYEEQQFGISMSEAFRHLMERVESMDLRYFVGAVLIQQETGGNLAELMEGIAAVIRSRLNFKSKVRSLTAMGRISTNLMIVCPVLSFFGLMLIAYEYEKLLIYTSVGRMMLMLGITMILVGSYALKKIISSVET